MDADEIVGHEEVDRQRTPNFARQGILTVTLVRLGPAAPFSMLNLAAAAICIPALYYLLGTAIGLIRRPTVAGVVTLVGLPAAATGISARPQTPP